MVDLGYLDLANGPVVRAPSSAKNVRDICLVDYSHCSTTDTCWLLDLDDSCANTDGCIIDTS